MSERRRYSLDKSSGGVAPIFEHFHTFKEFMQLQADNLEPGVAVGLYDQYKYDYKVFSSRKMFQQSQERRSGFACDRYAPANLQILCRRKVRLARTAAQRFLSAAPPQPHFEYPLGSSATVDGLHFCQHPSGRVIGTIRAEDGGAFKGDPDALRLASGQSSELQCTLVLRKLPSDVTLKMLEDLCTDVAGQPLAGFLGATLVPSCLTDEHRGPLLLQASKDVADCTEQEQADIQHSLSECYIRAKGGALYPLLTGWLEFDSEESCSAAEILLDQKSIGEITTAKPQRLRAEKPRCINIVSAAPAERLASELALARRLIERLDADFHVYDENYNEDPAAGAALKGDEDMDKGDKADDGGSDKGENMNDGVKADPPVVPNPFLASLSATLSTTEALDLCTLYLRQVHLMDLYSGWMCWSARELLETCGSGSLRLTFGSDVSGEILDSRLVMRSEEGVEFDKRVDELLSVPYDQLLLEIDENHPLYQSHWVDFAANNTVRVDEEKFRCGICKKLFKGPDFVHKHIKNKHQEEIAILLKNVSQQLMNRVFEADDAKLLLFVANSTDYMRVYPKIYGPQRRAKSATRASPLDRPSPTPFRDWDAPRTRLEDKAAGGNFRRAVRYDDL